MSNKSRSKTSSLPFPEAADLQPFTLTDAMLERLARYGDEQHLTAASVVFTRGVQTVAFFVVLEGRLEASEQGLGRSGAATRALTRGHFIGELDLLGGRKGSVHCRATKNSLLLRIEPEALQRIMHTEVHIAEVIMQSWISKRSALVANGAGGAIIVGLGKSAETMRIQQFLGRNDYPFRTIDAQVSPNAAVLLDALALSLERLPVVFLADRQVLHNPSNPTIAKALGFWKDLIADELFDVAIVGAGPSGLAAAVYAASEGLRCIVIEGNAPGGQAGTSSRIENYLGFPTGVTGQELTSRAEIQARKFGARLEVSRSVVSLARSGTGIVLNLAGGEKVLCKAAVIATGARYRKLSVPGCESWELRSIHYAATPIEAAQCTGRSVVVVGGGNSAGQAAIHLAARAECVHLVVRGTSVEATMSDYLVKRLSHSDRIRVHLQSEVTGILGGDQLEEAVISNRGSRASANYGVSDVFVMIGADPNTDWLEGSLELDRHGFVLTGGGALRSQFATSIGGVFAIGDVRAGSVKRVASAVGEGSAVISDVHHYLAALADL